MIKFLSEGPAQLSIVDYDTRVTQGSILGPLLFLHIVNE